MSAQKNVQIVKDGFAAFGRGDIQGMLALFEKTDISWPSRTGAGGHLEGTRPCLRVDILPDVRHFAISNGKGEDPMSLERPIRGFDSSPVEADDQNQVSLRYEFAGL